MPVNLDEELAVRGQQVEVNLQDTAQVYYLRASIQMGCLDCETDFEI